MEHRIENSACDPEQPFLWQRALLHRSRDGAGAGRSSGHGAGSRQRQRNRPAISRRDCRRSRLRRCTALIALPGWLPSWLQRPMAAMIFARRRPDIVHTHLNPAARRIGAVAQRLGIPHVLTLHLGYERTNTPRSTAWWRCTPSSANRFRLILPAPSRSSGTGCRRGLRRRSRRSGRRRGAPARGLGRR